MIECSRCKNSKEIKEFYKDKTSKNGLQGYCKECSKINSTKQRKDNPLIIKEYYKKFKTKNPEYHINNSIIWRKKNKKYSSIYSKNRKQIDPEFRLSEHLRTRINIKFNKFIKLNKDSLKIIDLLGCSLNEYKQHIESQFKPEMNWSNQGKIWEIDHIIPISKFDLTNQNEQKKAFHYTNTQPLFKTTQIAKQLGYNEIGNRNKLKTKYNNDRI